MLGASKQQIESSGRHPIRFCKDLYCQALNLPVSFVSRQLPAKSSEALLTQNPLTDGRFKLGQSSVASVLLLNPSPADPARAVQENTKRIYTESTRTGQVRIC